jgi:hypothetical protein
VSSDHGQASLEYLAVVALVAPVLGVAMAVLVTTALGEQVMAAFARALCVVTGGPCDDAARACVVGARQHTEGGHLNLVIWRVGGQTVELRETRADGSIAVTLVDQGAAGLDVGTGLEAHVRWGTSSWAAGAELRAAVLAERASGRTWVVRDAAAAQALVGRVREADRTRRPQATIAPTDYYSPYPPLPPEVHAPPPDETFSERAGELTVDFLGAGGRAAVHLDARQAFGQRVERATGRRTVYVRWTGAGRGAAFSGRAGVAAEGAGQERYGITFDRAGRPVDFEVLSAVDVTGTASLPPSLAQAAGMLGIPLHGERHVETEQHLDLADPISAAVVQDYLRALGSGPGVLVPLHAALRERLAAVGATSVRTYAASLSAHEVGGQARIGGVGVGGEAGSEDRSTRLLSAIARAGSGPWRADRACGVAA